MKRIPLVHGRGVALVDDEDYSRLAQYRWYYVKGYARRVTAYRMINGYSRKRWERTWIYMHREILGNTPLEVDHIDGNALDNRKKNLRLVTRLQQMWNQHTVRSKSGIMCVYWDKARARWSARIKRNGEVRSRRFVKKAEAAQWINRQRKLLEQKHAYIG